MSAAAQIPPRPTIDAPIGGQTAAAGPLDDRLLVICVLSVATALMHVAAALEHVREYVLYALFFAVLAPLQLAWGISVYRRATFRRVVAGAAVSLLIAGLWIISRTTGLPIGPQPWHPEAVGAVDAIATANEIAVGLLAVAWTRAHRGQRVAGAHGRVTVTAGVILVALSALALTSTGHGS